jgi:hypothetical protein
MPNDIQWVGCGLDRLSGMQSGFEGAATPDAK